MAVIERVNCTELHPGMYVSQLDRPWLETPFLFQGFEIRSDREIAELRRYCEHVFVDVEESRFDGPYPSRLKASHSQRVLRTQQSPMQPTRPYGGILARLRGMLRRSELRPQSESPTAYQDQQPVEVELPVARSIHSRSLDITADAMRRIREGGSLSADVIDDVVNPMIDSVLRNHDALMLLTRMARTHDYLYSHSVGCAVYAIAFGRHLGLDRKQLQILGTGGLLLDVGKTRLPSELLCKEADLSEDEFAVLRTHVDLGLEILSETPGLNSAVIDIVRTHHERFDGKGYPAGLANADIPVYGRIAGIVDHYDAMITEQPYSQALSPYDAMRELHKAVNIEFQAEMVEQFIRAIGMFPNGTLVELSNGEVGIVLEQNNIRRLRPKVMTIINADGQPLEEFRTLDLREFPAEPGVPGAIWIHRGVDASSYDIDPADYFI